MDKIFNFFSKTKSKEEIEKQKRNTVINTQNLKNFENINHSYMNNNKENNSSNTINNSETCKTINFTSLDFENIDKIINEKQESNFTNSENNLNENHVNYPAEIKSDSTLEQTNLINQAQNFVFSNSNNHNNNNFKNTNGPNSKPAVGDVVMVNSIENIKKPNEGFYSKKYRDQISKLKSSNPILIDRENMKVNFDKEAIDYLVNDMTYVFRERQYSVDSNQEKIIKNIEEGRELISIFAELNNEKSTLSNLEFANNKKKMINEIDYIDVLVNALNKEVDDLMNQIDTIEKLVDASKNNNLIIKSE